MRTWSVSGTAFALCTRSSSLSMRTRTSMAIECSRRGGFHLFGRVFGRSRASLGEQLAEALGNRLRDELVHLPAERGDLLDAARGDEAVLRARHDVHRLDVRRERAVQVVHL